MYPRVSAPGIGVRRELSGSSPRAYGSLYYAKRNSFLKKRVQIMKLQEQFAEALTGLEIASGRFIGTNEVVHLK